MLHVSWFYSICRNSDYIIDIRLLRQLFLRIKSNFNLLWAIECLIYCIGYFETLTSYSYPYVSIFNNEKEDGNSPLTFSKSSRVSVSLHQLQLVQNPARNVQVCFCPEANGFNPSVLISRNINWHESRQGVSDWKLFKGSAAYNQWPITFLIFISRMMQVEGRQ